MKTVMWEIRVINSYKSTNKKVKPKATVLNSSHLRVRFETFRQNWVRIYVQYRKEANFTFQTTLKQRAISTATKVPG